jgi:hypothetical protein
VCVYLNTVPSFIPLRQPLTQYVFSVSLSLCLSVSLSLCLSVSLSLCLSVSLSLCLSVSLSLHLSVSLTHTLTLDEEWLIMLSTRAYYKMENGHPRTRKDLLSLHSVVPGSQPNRFIVYAYKHMVKQSAVQALSNVGLGTAATFGFLQKREFECSNSEEVYDWILMFNSCMRTAWHQLLERSLFRAPEVYQYHAQVIKINRKNKAQDRVAVLSDSWLYNIEMERNSDSVRIKDMRWALPINSFNVVQLTQRKGNADIGYAITVYADAGKVKQALKTSKDHIGSKGAKVNDVHTFSFHTLHEREMFLNELARLYVKCANTDLSDPNKLQRLQIDAKEDMTISEVEKRRSTTLNPNPDCIKTGYMVKYTKGGKARHQKFISLQHDGMIRWGDHAHTKQLKERVLSLILDVKELKNNKMLPANEQALVFGVQTTGKTLWLLPGDQALREQWIKSLQSVIG